MIDRYLPAIDTELRRSLKPVHHEADGLYDMSRYFLGWQDEAGRPIQVRAGKRYRPILCLLICESLGGKWKRALPAAASIEFFHNFTLVHDDIQDHDTLRRGRKTVWAVWGMEQAINVGDALYGICANAALRSPQSLEVMRILTTASIQIIEGQYLDLSFLKREKISVEEYLTMLRAKTAVLVGAAAEIGALIATGEHKDRKIWKKFGEAFGFAYQLYDDYQGVWGTSDKTGKQEAGDVREGKKTLPFIAAVNNLPQPKSHRLATLYSLPQRSPNEIREAIVLMREAGSDIETRHRALNEKKKSLNLLDQSGLREPFRSELLSLINQLIPWQKQ